DLLARRPDIMAAEARMEAAGLRARAARKEFLPRLTLSSAISTSGPDISDLTDPNRLAGNIAAGLFQPLFQGGQILANSRRQRANAEASLFAYAQTVLNAYQDAEDAIGAEQLLADREAALQTAFEEAAAAEDITERRYLGGAASIFDLLNAQTRRISSEQSYILAKQQRLSNRVQLYLAIGGDFLTDIGEPASAEASR
ncbi:MAG: TolC family protein, partial [Parvularculaceae bacterium]|nr:TolC family protein [Parvularculaceae bacterium]